MSRGRTPPVMLLAGAHCAGGSALLAQPTATARAVNGDGELPPTWLVRLLGARLLIQGATELFAPTTRTVCAGSAVDFTHALTMAGIAVLFPHHRRAAVTSACAAVASAVFGVVAAGRTR